MASTTVVKVKVEELTKYGFKANGRYVNYSKQISETDKAKVVPGAEFEAEFYVADSGKEYLNKVLSTVAVVTTVSDASVITPKTDVERTKKFTPSFNKDKVLNNSMSKTDWAAKDRSQLIGGLSHDAATIAAVCVNISGQDSVSEALTTYKALLEGMLKIREDLR